LTLVDTNVLIDILSRDLVWYDWSAARFAERQALGRMAIIDVVYAECSVSYDSAENVSRALEALAVERDTMSDAALWRAGRAFRDYRRQGGSKTNVLADFFIGAQAETLGASLLTRDGGRYRTYFPDVEIIGP
jgi:predicted nucleic acid-binding protein